MLNLLTFELSVKSICLQLLSFTYINCAVLGVNYHYDYGLPELYFNE